MDESFDANLIERLRNYSEEPRMELWQRIAASAEANRPRARHKRLGSTWILILGVVAVGGLYYLERTKYFERAKSNITPAAGLSASVSASLEKNENGDVGLESPISKGLSTSVNDVTSGQSVGSSTTTNRDNVKEDDNKVWLNQEPRIEDHEKFTETNADEDEAKFDEGPVDNVPIQRNEIENTTNPDVEKAVETKAIITAAKDDEGKTVIKEKEKKQNGISIYFTIMPTFGYQRINANSNDDILIGMKRISAFSTDRLGVRAEVGVEDPITQRIKVFGGLVYYQRKQTIDYTQTEADSIMVSVGPDGKINFDSQLKTDDKSFEYELKNLGVQIGVSMSSQGKSCCKRWGQVLNFMLRLISSTHLRLQSSQIIPVPTCFTIFITGCSILRKED
ncbi:MAG TPA: hypothetical protein VK589_06290 [Chryseolinea sp.]|nr:hypothetical protein [Chryseolinea sp.]